MRSRKVRVKGCGKSAPLGLVTKQGLGKPHPQQDQIGSQMVLLALGFG